MKYKHRCIFGIQKGSTASLIVKSRAIQNALNEPQFNQVVPTTANVSNIITQLEAAQEQCSERTYKFVPVRDALKKQLMEMLRLQCDSVNTIAQGNVDVLITSGFPLQKSYSQRPLPLAGEMRSVKAGRNAGEIAVRAIALKNLVYYIFEVRQADGTIIRHSSSKASATIPDITQNMDIEVRVCGANARGMGDWSECLKYSTPRVLEQSQINSPDSLKVA